MPRGRPKVGLEDPTKSYPKEDIKKMSAQDREPLKAQVAELEAQLESKPEGGAFYSPQVQDPGALKKQLEHKKMLLQKDDDLSARGSEKDRLYARKKEIEGILSAHKPTAKEMSQMPTGNNSSAFSRAVDHNVKYQEKYQKLEHELQDLNVRLEPDDPNAHNLEYLRSDVSDGAVTV